jgi:hypothetical protein
MLLMDKMINIEELIHFRVQEDLIVRGTEAMEKWNDDRNIPTNLLKILLMQIFIPCQEKQAKPL